MVRVPAQNEADSSLLQLRSDLRKPFDKKLIVAEIGVMRMRHQLKKHHHRFAQTITCVNGGRKRRIVDCSLGALHPVNHASSVCIRLPGAANGQPGIAENSNPVFSFGFGFLVMACRGNGSQHLSEHQLVHRIQHIPIHQSGDTDGIEDRSLANQRGRPFVFNGKFQPRSSGKPHFGGEEKSLIIFKSLDAPKIEGIANLKQFGIAPPPANADTAK